MRDLSMEQVLNTRLYLSEEYSIREYLAKLLTKLITEEEGFSGKRPFGNSGWLSDLYFPLLLKHPEKDTISDEEEKHCKTLINAAIKYAFL